MFKIPIKKVRGIEDGTYVVLADGLNEKACEKNPYIDPYFYGNEDIEQQGYVLKFFKMGYVLDNPFRDKSGYRTIIPVVFDSNDYWQRNADRYLWSKQKTFIMNKSILVHFS